MTTRRAFLALLLTAALAAPGAEAAPPAPQLRDHTGDWPVRGQDIVWARLSGVVVDGLPHLRAELRLAAPPLAAVPNNYFVRFVHGCDRLQFRAYSGPLESEVLTAEYDRLPYCYSTDDDPGPDGSYPVTVSVRGSTVTWIAPYAHGMRRGSVLSRFDAQAFSVAGTTGVGEYDDPSMPVTTGGATVRQGDDAAAPHARYVVGSDLPRR